MTVVKVPLFNEVYRNVDDVEMQDKQYQLIDGYLSELGGTNKRPGLGAFKVVVNGAEEPVDGVYWWTHKDCAIVICNTHVYKLTYENGLSNLLDLGAEANLISGARPTFTTDGTYVYIANGAKIVYTNGTNAPAAIADADAPTAVSHIAFLDGYLLANSVGTNKFYWSDVNDPSSWNALSYASAAGNADHITALHVLERQIYLFGPETLEIWENDGTTPFSRVPGGFKQVGCIAPYSIVVADDGMYWLNNKRRLVKFNGSGIERLSTSYDKEIESLSSVSDCRADHMEIDGRQFMAFSLPTANRTFVYNVGNGDIAEWGRYCSEEASYSCWRGNCYVYAPSWGKHIVGDSASSTILEMSSSIYDDNGEPIRILRRSGHIDYGTGQSKRCKGMTIRLKRGTSSSPSAKLMLRWKDDNKAWSNEHWIDLGGLGNRQIVMKVYPFGIYCTRQYEFACTANVPVTFIDAEEDIDLL